MGFLCFDKKQGLGSKDYDEDMDWENRSWLEVYLVGVTWICCLKYTMKIVVFSETY